MTGPRTLEEALILGLVTFCGLAGLGTLLWFGLVLLDMAHSTLIAAGGGVGIGGITVSLRKGSK